MDDETKLMAGGGTRCSPRVVVSLPVEVEISGQTRQLNLISKDIGGGGIFLRTPNPAPLWSKVKISLQKSNGTLFQLAGEVVRSVNQEKSRSSGHPSGMAVAFDESSRSKQKELVAIVLELCSQRNPDPQQHKLDSPQPKIQPKQPGPKIKTTPPEDESEKLLDEIDKLLDSVEIEMDETDDDIAVEIDLNEDQPVPEKKVVSAPVAAQRATQTRQPSSQPSAPTSRSAPVPPTIRKPPTEKPNNEKPTRDQQIDALKHYLFEYKRTRKGSTYYHVLGIPKQATSDQIEKAYQHLLQKLRPQCQPELLPADLLQELTGVLGKIRKAFAILSKPDRRDAYDFLINTQ